MERVYTVLFSALFALSLHQSCLIIEPCQYLFTSIICPKIFVATVYLLWCTFFFCNCIQVTKEYNYGVVNQNYFLYRQEGTMLNNNILT